VNYIKSRDLRAPNTVNHSKQPKLSVRSKLRMRLWRLWLYRSHCTIYWDIVDSCLVDMHQSFTGTSGFVF